MGFSLLRVVTNGTVRSYRTFSPLPVRVAPSAVLLSAPLSVVLPRPAVVLCVARTFLPVLPRGGCLFCLRGRLYKVSLVSGSLKSAAKPEPRNHCADLDGWATIRHLVLPIHPANGPAWFSGCLNFLTFIGRLSNRFYVT